jgi:hypothetical protein
MSEDWNGKERRRIIPIVYCSQEKCPLVESINKIMYAFPDGPEHHRAAHEAWIKAKHAEEKFWMELKLDLAKKGTWAVLIIVLGLVVLGCITWVRTAISHIGG